MSANHEFAEALARTGHLTPASLRAYASGRLGIYSKRPEFRTLESLTTARLVHVAVANPLHAPYGMAAKQALEKAGLWRRLQPKIVYGENVVQAYQLAASGNAEAAIVAWSLIHRDGGTLIDPALYTPLRQTAGATPAAPPGAIRFLDWLLTPRAQSVLARYGFFPPLPPRRNR